jgi:hypothetical protein
VHFSIQPANKLCFFAPQPIAREYLMRGLRPLSKKPYVILSTWGWVQ